jgi:heme exporter protein D
MAIGLGADAAVAAMKGGDRAEALSGLAHALEALWALDPSASLRAAYVHRVIRHAILWAQSLVEGKELKIGDVPITMEAGACSNPDPVPAVRNLPLGPIDAVWHLLAETEAAAGLDLGIAANIDSKLTQGPIPLMQSGLHVRMMRVAIDQLDPARFVACFWTYIDSAIDVWLALGSSIYGMCCIVVIVLTTFKRLAQQRAKDARIGAASRRDESAQTLGSATLMFSYRSQEA